MRYNGGIIRKVGGRWQAEVNQGYRRHRRHFATREHAEGWINDQRLSIARSGAPLPATAAEHAADALQRLPSGVSIMDAVTYWIDRHQADNLPMPTVKDLADRYLSDRAAAGRRPTTLTELRCHLGALVAAFGERPVDAVQPAELADWLGRWHGRTRLQYHVNAASLFRLAVRLGHLTRSPLDAVPRPLLDDVRPQVFTPQQAGSLLVAAVSIAPEVVPYLAIGLFAGLRSAELAGLAWDDITPGTITVSGRIAKRRRTRHVTIQPNLAAWLAAHGGSGRIAPAPITVRRRLALVRAVAGIRKWPPNGMRHSFASYHLAAYQDAGRTALELGHGGDPALLYGHYRALVTREAALAYWAILP